MSLPHPAAARCPILRRTLSAVLVAVLGAASIGAEVRKLNGTLVGGGDVRLARISPDGAWVVYLADQDTDGVDELYSVPIDGSQPPVKLHSAPVVGGDVDGFDARLWHFTPDGSRIVFRADLEIDVAYGLYSAPIDGSAPAVRLNGPLVPGGFGDSTPWVEGFTSGGLVVFIARKDSGPATELYSAPADGSAPAQRLDAPLGSVLNPNGPRGVRAATLHPDGLRVVHQVMNATNAGLYIVPADGSAEATLLHATQSGLDWYVAEHHVVYRLIGGQHPYFSRALDAPEVEIALTAPEGWTREVSLDARARALVYQSEYGLSSVPSDGSRVPLQITPTMVSGGVSALRPMPDGQRVLYVANHEVNETHELYLVTPQLGPRMGRFSSLSGSRVKLNRPLLPGEDVLAFPTLPFHWDPLTPDGNHVVFFQTSIQGAGTILEVWSAPTRSRSPAVPLSGASPPNGTVTIDLPGSNFEWSVYPRISANSRRVAFAVGDSDEVVELYEAPVAGGREPTRVNGTLVSGGNTLGPQGALVFELTPDGDAVVYIADQDVDGVHELYVSELEPLP